MSEYVERRRIAELFNVSGIADVDCPVIYDILIVLPHPIWRQKGGAKHGTHYHIYRFRRSERSRLLRLQVA